jgi:hypothetical protein
MRKRGHSLNYEEFLKQRDREQM